MSPTNDMKARLFVDMDGTLAVWKQAACFEDLLQPGYFRDLPPYQTVLDAVKILCTTKPELDVYALSAYIPENQYAVSEKNAWLDAYLPEIDSEHRIFVACGSSKARAAANRLKTPCIDNSFVLLDDYSVNLHEWKANRGSCIKLRNGINGNGGTWKGESVTRFDTAENIADRIWSIIKKQMQRAKGEILCFQISKLSKPSAKNTPLERGFGLSKWMTSRHHLLVQKVRLLVSMIPAVS